MTGYILPDDADATVCYAVYKVWGVGGRNRELITTCADRGTAVGERTRLANTTKEYVSFVIEPLTSAPPVVRKPLNTATGATISKKTRQK